jgi:hypothetical protein
MTKGTTVIGGSVSLQIAQKIARTGAIFLVGLNVGAPAFAADAPPTTAPVSYISRPIYSEPSTGLQLPPGCEVDPTWRTTVPSSDLEIWIAKCADDSRIWLLKRAVVEVLNSRQSRLRFEVIDERIVADETPGESLSVQCTGPRDESGYVVRGAHWRAEGKELRLKNARSVMKADTHTQTLVDSEIGDVDCSRFPEREAMMKRLQQAHE